MGEGHGGGGVSGSGWCGWVHVGVSCTWGDAGVGVAARGSFYPKKEKVWALEGQGMSCRNLTRGLGRCYPLFFGGGASPTPVRGAILKHPPKKNSGE